MMMRISEDKERLKATVESLKEANAELKLAQKEIIKAEKMAAVGRLSAGIAHEIGNPISIVLGYLDLLKKEKVVEEERNDFIVRVEKEIKRIHLIIRGLLDFSRPANGPAQSFSAHEVLHELSDMVKLQPFMSKINLTFDLSAGNDIVLGNPNSLKQVFLNLLINAADSVSARHRPDGRISICTENIIINEEGLDGKKQILQIKVNDNGTGISENEVENIFDPFFTTKAPGKGTGLGLFVCFMLVQDMEGNIQAESRLNEGTTMIVKLPVCDINIKQNTEFRRQNPEGRK
jgi:signal transduction histidine kinase